MDSLTQIVLGAAVGEVVLGKKIGNRALFWGAIAGTIPDLDVFVRILVSDKMTATLMHRAFTHSFLFSFLMAPIFGYLLHKIFKRSKATFKDWTILFFWGFLTHILLDVQTTYGTQLLWPFHNRLAISNIFVVDPLYTIPFLIFVITVMFYKRSDPKRAKINRIGLYISSFYLLLTMVFKAYSFQKFTKNLKQQNISYNRIETGPTPMNSILWYANVETDDSYYVGAYSLFDTNDTIKFKKFNKNTKLRKQLKEYRNFKRMNKFSKNWYLLTEKDGNVNYNNIRFGIFGFEENDRGFVFNQQVEFVDNDIEFKSRQNKKENPSDFLKKMLQKVYKRAKGN